MKPIVCALLAFVSTLFRSRLSLQSRSLRCDISSLCISEQPNAREIGSGDRILWSWLARRWSGWRDALVFVQTGP